MTATAHALPRFLTGTAVMLVAPFGIEAATLGDIEVLSRPGEPLVAAISVDATANERIEASCVFLSRGSPETGPYVTGAKVGFETRAGRLLLHLRSNEAVGNPASRLRVVLRCPGETTFAYREYTALFTAPPPLAQVAPAVVPPPAAAEATATPSTSVPATPLASGGFPVQPGDSLDSIASLIFPREMDARRLYVDALREANPSLGSIAPREALPPGTRLALPDLRTFAQGRVVAPREAPAPLATPRTAAPRKSQIAEPPAPKLAPAPIPRAAPPSERVKPAPAPKALPASPPERAAVPIASAASASPPFVLKLSSSPVDLSRSRNIDDRERARIRERQRVLDSDDHVAAFLALRDSVQRLEGRVAELQLRLSTLSATQARIATPEPSPAPVPAKVAPKVEPVTPPPKPEPPKPEPPKVESPPPAKVVVSPAPPPPVETPTADPPKPELRAPEPVKVAPTKTEAPASTSLPTWLWVVVGVLAVFIGLLVWWLLTRRRASVVDEVFEDGPPSAELPLPVDPSVADNLDHFEIADDSAIDVAAPPRREIDSDIDLTTQVNVGDPTALRHRYIEERFPEIVNRTIVLDDPDSVVKAARLFYQEGTIPRAVELLQFATEENPEQVKPWLALFEIYRLERLTGEFADLARRFKETHGKTEYWRKVQFFGREIEPANALYRDIAVGIETIKFEAGKPPPPSSYDPIAENWLASPMDFENEVLANELRRGLMNQAGLSDQDLLPNPMPALRRVEMFTVA